MTTIASVSAVTTTSAQINFANRAGGGTIDLQVSPRHDFQFCTCPVYNVPNADSWPTQDMLNGSATYYLRARTRSAAGLVDVWSDVVAFRTLDIPPRNTAPAAVMIEPALFVMPEPILSFPQLYGGGNPGFPFENMGRDDPTVTRAYNGGASNIGFMLSGAPIDTVALLRTNLPEGAAVSITGYQSMDQFNQGAAPTAAFGGAFRASPGLPGRPSYHGIWRLAQPVVGVKLWRIQIYNVGAPFAEIGHAIFGLNRVTKNHAVEKSETPAPLTTIERKRSGTPDRVKGWPMRKVDLELQMLTEAQYETIYGDLWRREGDAALVIPNSKPGPFLHDRILFGDLSGGRTVNPTSPRYNRTFTINSLI